MIIGGLIGGVSWGANPIVSYVYTPLFFVPMILAVIGGIMAFRRVHYKWALAGAICSLLFPFFGIPAVILLVKRKGEFFSRETAIQGDERQECLAYYEEEKKLRLLYERVEWFYDKRIGKYEDAFFEAQKAVRDSIVGKATRDDPTPIPPMEIMDKIFEARGYMSYAATEIVKRKKEMRLAPSSASEMSSAWLAAYLYYEALRDASNIVAGSDPVIFQIRRQREKGLSTNFNKSLHKAWQEEKDFRKRLKLSSSEYQRIVDNAAKAVATDEWLRKLEAECP